MIISKTPFRISYLGGGTDFPEWYLKNTGKVLSTTIDKYNYVALRGLQNIFKYNYRVRYYYNERCKNINEIKHPTIRNLAKLGVFVFSMSYMVIFFIVLINHLLPI